MTANHQQAFLANAVLLANLPDNLLNPNSLRDVIYTCGGTRGYTISKEKKMAVVRMQNRVGAALLVGESSHNIFQEFQSPKEASFIFIFQFFGCNTYMLINSYP